MKYFFQIYANQPLGNVLSIKMRLRNEYSRFSESITRTKSRHAQQRALMILPPHENPTAREQAFSPPKLSGARRKNPRKGLSQDIAQERAPRAAAKQRPEKRVLPLPRTAPNLKDAPGAHHPPDLLSERINTQRARVYTRKPISPDAARGHAGAKKRSEEAYTAYIRKGERRKTRVWSGAAASRKLGPRSSTALQQPSLLGAADAKS